MHPIFALLNPERLRAIRDDLTLSVCLQAAWDAESFRSLGLRADLLPPAA